jgi:hypothetical protein
MSLRWSTAGGFEVGLEEAQFDLRNFEHFQKLWKSSELGRFGDLSCQKPTGADDRDDRDDGDGKAKSTFTYLDTGSLKVDIKTH